MLHPTAASIVRASAAMRTNTCSKSRVLVRLAGRGQQLFQVIVLRAQGLLGLAALRDVAGAAQNGGQVIDLRVGRAEHLEEAVVTRCRAKARLDVQHAAIGDATLDAAQDEIQIGRVQKLGDLLADHLPGKPAQQRFHSGID